MGDRHRPPVDGCCSLLSDWEVDEARRDNLAGIPVEVLAERYGVSGKAAQVGEMVGQMSYWWRRIEEHERVMAVLKELGYE